MTKTRPNQAEGKEITNRAKGQITITTAVTPLTRTGGSGVIPPTRTSAGNTATPNVRMATKR